MKEHAHSPQGCFGLLGGMLLGMVQHHTVVAAVLAPLLDGAVHLLCHLDKVAAAEALLALACLGPQGGCGCCEVQGRLAALAYKSISMHHLRVPSTGLLGLCSRAMPRVLTATSTILVQVGVLAVTKQASLEGPWFDLLHELEALGLVCCAQPPTTVLRGPVHGGLADCQYPPYCCWTDLLLALLSQAGCNACSCLALQGRSPGPLSLGPAEASWPA